MALKLNSLLSGNVFKNSHTSWRLKISCKHFCYFLSRINILSHSLSDSKIAAEIENDRPPNLVYHNFRQVPNSFFFMEFIKKIYVLSEHLKGLKVWRLAFRFRPATRTVFSSTAFSAFHQLPI